MKSNATRTARFAVVVKECGQPEPVFLWTKPEDNPDLMSAIRHNRMMTLKQETQGIRKDFGEVGFVQEKNASYLIFPKPLNRFTGMRIVGINYELIKTPGPRGRIVTPKAHRKNGAGKARRTAPVDQERDEAVSASGYRPRSHTRFKTFRVRVRFTAAADVDKEVTAASVSRARELALKETRTPDFSRATITKKIVKAQPQ
jgi:hypothetical protein